MINEISVEKIEQAVCDLCIHANYNLPCDIKECINKASITEKNPLACNVLSVMKDNAKAADEMRLPICQDTGMAVVFLDIGQDVHIVGGNLTDAVNSGVAKGYINGYLRKSVVSDPINRINSGDNTPAVIHTRIVEGRCVKITVVPKGFGSENMSAVKMLTPYNPRQSVVDFVLETVKNAGANPCPPIVVGVGIGSDFEGCAMLSKIALCRSTDVRNPNTYYAELEQELLTKINELNIGPQGFGGSTTALAVNIETFATHIAGLPVAVNIGCHVTRHATALVE